MVAITLDGELAATELKESLKQRIAKLAELSVIPGLGTILVGDDGPSKNYISMKHRDCKELGMHSQEITLPADTSQHEIIEAVEAFNHDPQIHAFIIPVSYTHLRAHET